MKNTLVHPWMIDPRDGLPLRALGVRKDGRPIYPIMGASDDDADEDAGDDADEDAGDDADEDAGDEDDPDADKTPEQLKAELKALRSAKARLLREKQNLAKRTAPKPKPAPKPSGKDGTFTKEELDEQRREAQEAERAGLMPTLIRTAAEGRLERAGLTLPDDPDERRAKLKRVLKLVDTDAVEIDDEGELIGLDDAVDALKEDYPELFKGAGRRAPRPGNVGGGKSTDGRPKTATQIQAEFAFGRR